MAALYLLFTWLLLDEHREPAAPGGCYTVYEDGVLQIRLTSKKAPGGPL